jgi:hypothetical protein
MHRPLKGPEDNDNEPFWKTTFSNWELLTPDTTTNGTPSVLTYENVKLFILNEEEDETLIRGVTKVSTAISKLTPDILVSRLELTLKVAYALAGTVTPDEPAVPCMLTPANSAPLFKLHFPTTVTTGELLLLFSFEFIASLRGVDGSAVTLFARLELATHENVVKLALCP